VFSLKLSSERDRDATRNPDFLTYEGGGVELLGFSRGDRDMPWLGEESNLDLLPLPPRAKPNPSQDELAAARYHDRLVNMFAPAMGTRREDVGRDLGLSLVAGNRFPLGRERVFGAIGAVTWKRSADFYEGGENNTVNKQSPTAPLDTLALRSDSQGTQELLLGALADVVFQPGSRHDYSLKLILNQSAGDSARFQEDSLNPGQFVQNQSLHYVERTVATAQIHGEHRLAPLSVHWFFGGNRTRQNEPDVRFFKNLVDPETGVATSPTNSTAAQNTRRIFRDTQEDGWSFGADVPVPFEQWAGLSGQVKAGVYAERTDRTFDQQSFTYDWTLFQCCASPNQSPAVRENVGKRGFDPILYPGEDVRLWTDVFARPANLGLADNWSDPRVADNQLLWTIKDLFEADVEYTGDQAIDAFYAMVELPLTRRLELNGGARRERTDLAVFPTRRDHFVPTILVDEVGNRSIVQVPDAIACAKQGIPEEECPSIGTVDEKSWLPAVGLSYEIVPDMKLRASWSRTIARPTLRELTPAAAEDFLGGDSLIGNTALELSEITNEDLRWEWFRGGDLFAASVFVKEIDDPIEYINFTATQQFFVQPVNFERGEVRGAEVEARVALGQFWEPLKGLSVGGNYTRLDSEVEVPLDFRVALAKVGLDCPEVPGVEVPEVPKELRVPCEPTRQLQGQPTDVSNLNLTWYHERFGTAFSAFYNRVGRTLATGAASTSDGGVPNVYEEPYMTIDLKLEQDLRFLRGHDVSLSFGVKNLTEDERVRVFLGPAETPFVDSIGNTVVKSRRGTSRETSFSLQFEW
jgi:TonB-dependent receptor